MPPPFHPEPPPQNDLERLIDKACEDPQLLVPLEECHWDPTIRKPPDRLNGRIGVFRPAERMGQHGWWYLGQRSEVEAWVADAGVAAGVAGAGVWLSVAALMPAATPRDRTAPAAKARK